MKPRKHILPVATMAGLALVASSAHGLTIYSDDFSGDSGTDLHDTTPDVTTGDEKWVATSNYKANGSFTLAGNATMTLPFTPIDGIVYTLDAQIEDLGGSQWAQFGFGNGQPTTTVWSGRAWNLLRVASDTGNNHAAGLSGLAGLTNWSSLGLLRYGDDLDVRIVLDTTGGTGSWTATYYAKAGNVGTYTEVGSKTLTDETIDSVGFSTFNVPNEGKLNSFSLSYESGSNTTPPTLASVDIVDDQSGGPVAVGTPITYTLTFSEDMDHLTFNPTDFWDAGSDVSFGFLSITETSPGVIELVVTPDNPGTLQFQVNPGATLNDAAGNPLDTSAAIVDDTAITVRAEITPPTLASVDIVDDQAGGPVAVGTPITYTLTFSEDMDHLTFNPTDFWDAGSDVSFGFLSITETSPGVIELVVTPDNPGTLQFQVNPGATLNDAAGNPLDTSAAIVDDTAITVTSGDTTPPTLASVDIVDDQAGGPVAVGTPITYTLTFSEDMDHLTFNPTDFWDAGSDVSFGFLSITETSPGVIELVVTPDNPGTLQFQVNPGATLNDAAGNPLDTSAAIVDDTAITVTSGDTTPPTLASVDIVDDQAGGPVAVGTPITYTLTFSEDMDRLTFNPTDFWDAGSDVSFGFLSITETSPGVIELVVTPDNPGTLQFQVNPGATLNDAAGNPLDTSAAIVDDTAIIVRAEITPPTLTSVDIVDDQAGGPVAVGTPITYTLTFSEDMDRLTFNPTDFWDAGSDVSFGFQSITETSPGVIELVVTPDNPGTLQFQVNPGATLNDAAGNPLDTSTAIVDDTAIIVTSADYSTWATGNEPFDGDANGDGVADGFAFLLGAANPGTDATNLLPTVGESGGGLVMEFDCLATADRGASVLNLQYDGDLAAPWTSVPVPGAVGNTTVGNVSFVATANGSLIHIVATVDDATEAAAGKLFGRLAGTE